MEGDYSSSMISDTSEGSPHFWGCLRCSIFHLSLPKSSVIHPWHKGWTFFDFNNFADFFLSCWIFHHQQASEITVLRWRLVCTMMVFMWIQMIMRWTRYENSLWGSLFKGFKFCTGEGRLRGSLKQHAKKFTIAKCHERPDLTTVGNYTNHLMSNCGLVPKPTVYSTRTRTKWWKTN